MKNLKTQTIAFATIALLLGTSCKYEESGLSLRSKKAREVNTWKFETPDTRSENTRLELDKDESGSFYDNTTPSNKTDFTWEYNDSKENLKVTLGRTTSSIKILKLKNKSMWLSDKNEDIENYVSAE